MVIFLFSVKLIKCVILSVHNIPGNLIILLNNSTFRFPAKQICDTLWTKHVQSLVREIKSKVIPDKKLKQPSPNSYRYLVSFYTYLAKKLHVCVSMPFSKNTDDPRKN